VAKRGRKQGRRLARCGEGAEGQRDVSSTFRRPSPAPLATVFVMGVITCAWESARLRQDKSICQASILLLGVSQMLDYLIWRVSLTRKQGNVLDSVFALEQKVLDSPLRSVKINALVEKKRADAKRLKEQIKDF
jgi:hypothetical protein